MSMCVYVIKNESERRLYVGSASRFPNRSSAHRCLLRQGTHHTIALQEAWSRCGEGAFVFEIIERVNDPAQKLEREQYWMDYYRESGWLLYNTAPKSGGSAGIRYTAERRQQLSLQSKKNLSNPAHFKAFQEGRDRFLANPEARELARQRMIASLTPEYFAKRTEQLKDFYASESARATLSRQNRNRRPDGSPVEYNLIAPDGTVYRDIPNLSAFCRERGLSYRMMNILTCGGRSEYKGWTRLDAEPPAE